MALHGEEYKEGPVVGWPSGWVPLTTRLPPWRRSRRGPSRRSSLGAFGLMGGEYEQVVYNHDPASGLKAIIAIHSTALGPALGGTRFYPYASEDDALADVLRLARGMSYKAAVAGLNLGGGKAVIIGDPKRVKSEALLRAYGRLVESLGGRYITAEDVGTYIPDMDVVALETGFVTGRSPANGGGGDPSINTAYGVLKGMQAVAEELWNEHELAGRHVVVQGVGKVGSHLCHLLHEAGARLTVADVDLDNVARAVREFGTDTVEPGKAHAVECDIFAPCAMGASCTRPTTWSTPAASSTWPTSCGAIPPSGPRPRSRASTAPSGTSS